MFAFFPAPEFIQRLPATETVEEGSTVTFGCKVVGFPKPTITWYKDDDVITNDSRAKTEVGEFGVHSIHLKDVSKCDAGTYKIRASNLEGSSTSSLYITVKGMSRFRHFYKRRHIVAFWSFFVLTSSAFGVWLPQVTKMSNKLVI